MIEMISSFQPQNDFSGDNLLLSWLITYPHISVNFTYFNQLKLHTHTSPIIAPRIVELFS